MVFRFISNMSDRLHEERKLQRIFDRYLSCFYQEHLSLQKV